MRLPLLLTGKPCITPDARFAAPSANSSRLGSTRSPCLFPNARPVKMLSVYATNATPRAAGASETTSSNVRCGSDGTGSPAGIVPMTVTPRSPRSSRDTAAAAPTMPISAIGACGAR